MRLIDADALEMFLADNYGYPVIDILGDIAKFPTVDAVEVVRCKDCKHWHEETGWCAEHSSFIDADGAFCHPWESANWKMFDANDYCSYGKRKDDGR